jgi:quinol monooxygenase YgiN
LYPEEALAIRQQSREMEEHMIQTTIRATIPPQKRDEALKILRSVTEMNRVRLGCVSCRIYQDLQDKNVLMFEEKWTSEEDLEDHLRSDEFRNVLLLLEMAPQAPEIRFDTISSSTGMETVEKARTSPR